MNTLRAQGSDTWSSLPEQLLQRNGQASALHEMFSRVRSDRDTVSTPSPTWSDLQRSVCIIHSCVVGESRYYNRPKDPIFQQSRSDFVVCSVARGTAGTHQMLRQAELEACARGRHKWPSAPVRPSSDGLQDSFSLVVLLSPPLPPASVCLLSSSGIVRVCSPSPVYSALMPGPCTLVSGSEDRCAPSARSLHLVPAPIYTTFENTSRLW